MWFVGKNRGTEIIAKVLALQGFATKRDALGQLYGILTILDTKATGLLTVDALFIAIVSIFLASPEAAARIKVAVPPRVLECQLVLAAVSAFLCLLVVRVTWKFLGDVPDAPNKEADFDFELNMLANVIDDRTHYYWLAWFLALIAIILTLAWWSWWWAGVAAVVVVAWARGRG